jgi:hypothetical protein
MLILSKFKDYYDAVAGTTGIDKTIIYDRQTIEFKRKDYPTNIDYKFNCSILFSNKHNISNSLPITDLRWASHIDPLKSKYVDNQIFIIGFCGKLYVGWRLIYQNKFDNSFSYDITYDFEYFKSLLKTQKQIYFRKDINKIDEHYNKIINNDSLEIFRTYNTPIFSFENGFNYGKNHHSIKFDEKFIINPILKNYEFYKVFDTYQAFQEISMFIGGVLGSNNKEIIEIDNKHKILKYGFDLKSSFRKEKKL